MYREQWNPVESVFNLSFRECEFLKITITCFFFQKTEKYCSNDPCKVWLLVQIHSKKRQRTSLMIVIIIIFLSVEISAWNDAVSFQVC